MSSFHEEMDRQMKHRLDESFDEIGREFPNGQSPPTDNRAGLFADDLVSGISEDVDVMFGDLTDEILHELDQLRLEDDPDYNPHWREDKSPTLKDKLRHKLTVLKRGLTSEEAQEFALMVSYLGSCYAAGWAISKGASVIYNKIQEARNE